VRDRGGFDPVAGVQLIQDVGDVDAGGRDADHQRRGDLARFERAWAAGRRLPPARAVSFALAPLSRREAAAMLR
jgi:hypothetical protein